MALRPLVILDVPFLAQSEELCGGAAAAMVLRYWGDADAQSKDFESLVNRDRGGIAAGDLVSAIDARPVDARAVRAAAEDVKREIGASRPVIALIDAGKGRLHYVVVLAWSADRLLIHDPSVGPFRVLTEAEFDRRWTVTDRLAIFVTGKADAKVLNAPRPEVAPSGTSAPTACDALVGPAIETARGLDPEYAVPALTAASALCPASARAVTALAGVRFRQERWKEAADFARDATDREPADVENWRLLGASLYLADEPRAALAAWNHIGEPRIDRIQIEGLTHTHQDQATAALRLEPRTLLTVESIEHAERRLDLLPTSANSRVTYRPLTEGKADVFAFYGEGRVVERWPILLGRLAAEGAIKNELIVGLKGPTGRGEGVKLGWRFARHRPSAWASVETPGLLGLPGVVTLGGLWDRQTYRPGGKDAPTFAIETRRRAALDWTDWVTRSLRTEAGLGLDLFDGRRRYTSVRGLAEKRLAADRVAVLAEGAHWISLNDKPGFSAVGGTVAFRSRVRPRGVTFSARFDGRRATESAPLAVWPGAGKGPGRPLLDRGVLLVEDGYLVGDAFGRGLLHATMEAEAQAFDRGVARVGIAAFGDWARAWDRPLSPSRGPDVFSVGVGVRVRGVGKTVIRGDVAIRPGHKGVRVSGGATLPWPR